jgi:4-hydroxymandelate oxidase
LPARIFAQIKGSDRRAFDRMLFRPFRFVNTEHLDLSVQLFGETHFTPMIVGPVEHQQRFHPDGEVAMVRGASAAQTAVVVSSRSSQPIDKIAAEAKSALWFQVFPEADMGPVVSSVQSAVKAGCKAVCLTVGTPYRPTGADGPPNPTKLTPDGDPTMDWDVVQRVKKASKAPLVLKGIMSPDDAKAAVDKGVDGIIVSDYGGMYVQGLASPVQVLPSIVDAVGARVPVLIDGSCRRGTDMVKAIALGAKAVLVARPAVWGLSAYGAEGVQTVLELLTGELARDMGLCGTPTLADLHPNLVRRVKA